ncbi:MAG: RNA polymerase sigma factor [Bdellovibrionaceae bacterium]|nr:RNA polymerase sigma factor [Bdellovibrio sp.]
MSQKSDEELMMMYQIGSEEAFRVLYQRHASKILGFIKSKVRSAERSHDIFQEVFMKLHRSKALYKKNLLVLPWLFTITKNAIVDEVRKTKRTANQTPIDGLELPAAETETHQNFTDLAYQLANVPPQQRAAIEMRYVDGKTFEDISAALNTSKVNARQLISRGLSRLKYLIKEEDKS